MATSTESELQSSTHVEVSIRDLVFLLHPYCLFVRYIDGTSRLNDEFLEGKISAYHKHRHGRSSQFAGFCGKESSDADESSAVAL
eukprot:scaffold7076_cov149-Amphora_coffeaeformis.AAC.3